MSTTTGRNIHLLLVTWLLTNAGCQILSSERYLVNDRFQAKLVLADLRHWWRSPKTCSEIPPSPFLHVCSWRVCAHKWHATSHHSGLRCQCHRANPSYGFLGIPHSLSLYCPQLSLLGTAGTMLCEAHHTTSQLRSSSVHGEHAAQFTVGRGIGMPHLIDPAVCFGTA